MSTADHPGLSVAVDTGGTFTDVSVLDPATGRIWIAKTSSTPDDRSAAFIDGILAALAGEHAPPGTVARVLHGTTVATNMILEDKGAACGLLTTDGFRHVLEIGRHDIPRHENPYSWIKPTRPVPPERVLEVPGRLDNRGRELQPLDESAVADAADRLAAAGVEAVAVCFLHAYANPDHERRAGEILRARLPDVAVTLSSEVLPVFREYERSMTTVLNASVMPGVARYVSRLERRLLDSGIDAPLMLMKSSGGVIGATGAQRTPVQTALSGPAAGAIGARHVAARAGYPRCISLDVGGTSADVCLIDGSPSLTVDGRIGAWPVPLPMLDIHTIGSGGGSIARVSRDGELSVGPASAGADPGPAAYGRGGTAPTVTDAHVALGHLSSGLIGGALALDAELSREAIETGVAKPLGISVAEAARGILEVAANDLAGAIRVVSVQRGHDPRDFALLPFGGAGPLQAGAVARLLGLPTVLVPPHPGVLSSLGLLVAPLRNEFTRSVLHRPGDSDPDAVARAFAALSDDAGAWLAEERIAPTAAVLRRQAGMRYVHQGFELFVDWPDGPVDAGTVAAAVDRFHAAHRGLYTFDQPDTPVEIATLRVVAEAPQDPVPPAAADPAGAAGDAVVARRPADLGAGFVETPVLDRGRLAAGARIAGPAIVTELDSTTLVLAGQTATVLDDGALLIREVSG